MSADSTRQFLSPDVLATLKSLNLIAKTVVDGFLVGLHHSRQIGSGLAFNQYRPYQLGDDLRRVDWKLAARSDKFFVRESEAETRIAVRFILDCSASMRHEENGISKFFYAQMLAAALAYLADKQGDAIGLYAVQNRGVAHLPAKRHSKQLTAFLHLLEGVSPQGKWPDWKMLEPMLAALRRRELTIFITDMHEEHDEIFTALKKFAALHHEVMLCHLVGRREATFDYSGDVQFEDLETGEKILVHSRAAKEAVVEALNARYESLQAQLLEERIIYRRFFIQEPLDAALRDFIAIRNRI
jgi:uncharacterized protein (DUF58 family)